MGSVENRYDEVQQMFRECRSLPEDSVEFGRLRERIVEQCLPLADHIARRYSGRGEPHDDLVQVARVGLLNAVNRFDPDAGDFLGFAVPTMMGEVKRYFRDFSWSVKVASRAASPASSPPRHTWRNTVSATRRLTVPSSLVDSASRRCASGL